MAVGVEVVAEAVGFTAGAVEAVDFTAAAVVLPDFTVGAAGVVGMAEAAGSMDLAAFTAEAVGFMDLPPMVAWPTWVMGRAVTAFRLAACMHTDLLLTA
jgi:hypothetical protein